MKVKVDGAKLRDAMQRKLERMRPRMNELSKQEKAYHAYMKLKRSVPWYKRWTVWSRRVESPYDGRRRWEYGFYRVRYEELESAIRHMKDDESYFIDSLDFGQYGLK